MTKPRLQSRLLVSMLSLGVGTILATSFSLYIVVQSALRKNLDDALIGLARTELASATDMGFVHVHEPDKRAITVQGVPGYEKYVWVLDKNSSVVAHTKNVELDLQIPDGLVQQQKARKGHTVFGDIHVNGVPLRAVFYPFKDRTGQDLVGIVGVPSTIISQVISNLGEVILLICFASIGLTITVVLFLAKSLTKPLSDLEQSAEKIDLNDPTAGPLIEAPYEEINGVALAINRLMARVSTMFNDQKTIISTQRHFIADASHELRTPVSNIKGTLEVSLRRVRTPEEYRADIETSLREIDRMDRLINDLLSSAKGDLGQFNIRRERFDFNLLLRHTVDLFPVNIDRPIQIELSGSDQLFVMADPDRIRQVIDNLMRNAITYAASTIRLSAFVSSDRLEFSISNDGPDISPEDIEKIFDRFYRSDNSRSRDTGGSGLGLAIVKSIIEGHGGQMFVKSENGLTTFSFWIPTK